MRTILKYYILILLLILIGCAAQMSPQGGPIDTQGPQLLNISHSLNSNISNTDEKIIFYFDEFINPISIVNAINIINFKDYDYQLRGKKIILSPKKKWPNYNVIKVNISRNLSDLNGNTMNQPIQSSFAKPEFKNNNIINGKLINTNNTIFEIGLYNDKDNSLVEKTESNNLGEFQFQYLEKGRYIIIAVENKIIDLEKDLMIRRYGTISNDYIELFEQDSIYSLIRIDEPIEKLEIKSFRQINNSFGMVMLNNGLEKPFLIPKNKNSGDSLDININLSNRIEKYSPKQFSTFIMNIIDTIPPKVLFTNYYESDFLITFDEPITRGFNSPKIFVKKDTTFNKVDYSFMDSFTLQINRNIDSTIFVENIYDVHSNKISDTLNFKIDNLVSNNILKGGNIYGQIDYEGNFPIIIKAKSIDTDYDYYNYMDINKNFSFININPGFYEFIAYEILDNYDSTQYFNGQWEPFKRASKFGIYNDTLEVRAHWDIKNMSIFIK